MRQELYAAPPMLGAASFVLLHDAGAVDALAATVGGALCLAVKLASLRFDLAMPTEAPPLRPRRRYRQQRAPTTPVKRRSSPSTRDDRLNLTEPRTRGGGRPSARLASRVGAYSERIRPANERPDSSADARGGACDDAPPAAEGVPTDIAGLTERLATSGFVAAAEEAVELLAAAFGDVEALRSMVARRLAGEPLAWVIGLAPFCGRWITVRPGVYVPRRQSEPLVLRAAERLPANGIAVDVCTGSGALARTLMACAPTARVLACDIDPVAVECARANGVDAHVGDLFETLPGDVRRKVDVVVSVPPYVPSAELPLLQRDTFSFERPLAYDGGPQGVGLVRRIIAGSPLWLRPGGTLLLEVADRQPEVLAEDLDRSGFEAVDVRVDEDGDVRGLEARLTG